MKKSVDVSAKASEELKVLISGDLIFEGSVGRTDFLVGVEKPRNSIELVSNLDVEYYCQDMET